MYIQVASRKADFLAHLRIMLRKAHVYQIENTIQRRVNVTVNVVLGINHNLVYIVRVDELDWVKYFLLEFGA